MDTGRLCGLVDTEALHGEKVGHDTAKTAAIAAVGTKEGHLRNLVIANGQNDEARLKMARSLDGCDSSGRLGLGQSARLMLSIAVAIAFAR
jgi:hypothetical protein